MKVLIACEESQRVCIEFRRKGHEAYSCDIIECSGGHPEWHIQGDVLPLLNGHCKFKTSDGIEHELDSKWDMILAFPPCTHLAVSGARHFEKKREDGRQREGVIFFSEFLKADCEKVCIENPVNIISGDYVKEWFPDLCEIYGLPLKPTQHIQPYEFGDPYRKKTALWLKGLEPLKPTEIVEPKLVEYTKKDGRKTTFSANFCSGFNGEDRGKVRSKTYPGVAEAMAEQWGGEVYRTDNPLADFDQWEWEKEKQLRKRPKCDRCKGYIQDEYLYEVMGELYCEDCMNKHFRKASEDYEN